MAPMKRAAPVGDPDEGSDDDHGHDGDRRSSIRRASNNKRRRTSDESSAARDDSSDLDEEARNASTPPSDYETDEGDGDDDDEEAEAEITQAVEARKQSSGAHANEPAMHGILEAVELKNFMCHESMAYKLGPLINFICGRNGSGKSAILTAIVLCLGGKASSTNRGARLQNFIKEGQDHASILCKIKNQGDHAYMPDVYGNTIQVERHFSRTGGSGFKLKSEKGRIISTRRSDLDEICDHMMLQIDNPMTVLSQDQARQFIASSSPAEKYKFFMKGVQLEQLDQDYRIIEEQQENIRAKIEDRQPDLLDVKKRHESANNKMDLSQKYDSMLNKIRELRRQLAWAQVAEKETTRDDFAKEVEAARTHIHETEAAAGELELVYQRSSEAATAATDDYNAANALVARLAGEKNEQQRHQAACKQEVATAQAELRTIRDAMKKADEMIAKTTADIEQEERRLAERDGGGATQRLTQLRHAKDTLDQARGTLNDHRSQRPQRLAEIDAVRQREADAMAATKSREADVRQRQANLNQLRDNRSSQDLAYHANMPSLLRALAKESGFEHPPVGPIGKHVRLLKPEWSSILEKSFGSTLNSFVVTNKRDEVLLSNVMKRTRCHVPIFIVRPDPINTKPHEPDARFDTVLSVLAIGHELVKKQLVIAHAVEQTILIPDMADASKELYAGAQPKNVRRCYCFSADSRLRGAVLSYRGRNAAQDPIHAYVGTPRMQTDVNQSIRAQEEAVQDAMNALRGAVDDHRAAQASLHEAQQALARHDATTADLMLAAQHAEDGVEALNEAIASDSVEAGTLQVLQEAVDEFRKEKAVHEGSLKDSINEYGQGTVQLREATAALKESGDRVQEADRAAERAQNVAQRASKQKAHDLGEKNAVLARIRDGESDLKTMEEKLTTLNGEVASWTEQARQVSERVNIPAGETYASLEKRYTRLSSDYRKYHDQIGNRDQIAADAAKWSKAYEVAKREMQGLETLRDQLAKTMLERRFRWKGFRSHIAVRTRSSFMYMLSERGFRGRLVLNHAEKSMDIRVEPDITRRDGSGRSARTLSGGEKSFAQICLLLAIWEAMGVPIRCLDEFDVFMDAVNRSISVNLLIEGARHSIGGQFILISPGTKSDIKRAPDVTAIEIAAPERGQSRLVLAPAAPA